MDSFLLKYFWAIKMTCFSTAYRIVIGYSWERKKKSVRLKQADAPLFTLDYLHPSSNGFLGKGEHIGRENSHIEGPDQG